jgi:rhomboid protease GluP
VLRRIGLSAPVPASLSSLLGVAFVIVYGVVLLSAPGGGNFMNLPIDGLVRYGGHVTFLVELGDWWRLATACFLHAGLWHLGFNLLALGVIGPRVEEEFGRGEMLFVFLLTGVLANLGSGAMGLHGVGIGASGGLMGLVGLIAGWGHRDGTARGRAHRNDMLKWGFYTLIFGLAIGADNWAHGFGFASGLVLGLAVNPRKLRTRTARPIRIAIGALGVIGCAATFGLIVYGPPLPY